MRLGAAGAARHGLGLLGRLGLILAALIVGAAMLMSVPTTFRIFGYPGLAMIFFLAAAAGGLLLVVNILANDAKQKK